MQLKTSQQFSSTQRKNFRVQLHQTPTDPQTHQTYSHSGLLLFPLPGTLFLQIMLILSFHLGLISNITSLEKPFLTTQSKQPSPSLISLSSFIFLFSIHCIFIFIASLVLPSPPTKISSTRAGTLLTTISSAFRTVPGTYQAQQKFHE